MTIQYVITGLMIGLLFGMPIGAVGALSMQRTIRYGRFAGLLSGSASSVVDMLYACIGAFGLTILSDVLIKYQVLINVLGAILLMLIAIHMMYKKEPTIIEIEQDKKGYSKMFLSSFAIAIMNPAAIISFLFAFSVFDIHGTLTIFNGIQLVFGVFFGTLSWWILLVIVVNFMKQKVKERYMTHLNTVFGVVLLMCSVGILYKTF